MPHKDSEARQRSRWASHLKTKYSITSYDYYKLLHEQKGVCAICEKPETAKTRNMLSVDHNHKTGKVRGLLCHSCNLSLGGLKDSAKLAKKAAKYLRKHEGK